MDLMMEIDQLLEKHQADLGDYGWMYEDDRYSELIFCLLNQYNQDNTEGVRMAVSIMQYFGLADNNILASIKSSEDEDGRVIAYILRRHGFSKDDAQQAIALLARVAKVISNQYQGKIQYFLRRQGEIIRDELVKVLGDGILNRKQMRYAVSHWLQNTLNLPISLEHQAVMDFCRKKEVTLEELIRAVDDLDLNMALVDDLLEIEQRAEG